MLTVDVAGRAQRRVGTVLCGKWKLDAVLGVGGMAAVYVATHRNRHRVAIKLLHAELSFDETTRARFLREGYVANTIGHPGTVRVLDDDLAEDGSAFLVMELLEGESVEERCLRRGGKLPLEEALQIADQVLDVLAAAHDIGILHRDVKPDNLFITTHGELKVLDFGIARLRQGTGSTRWGSFMGTPGYSAPEQARGRWDEVDERSDLFAVGATLFAAIAGRPVHEAETPSEQLALAIGTPAPAFSSVVPDAPAAVAALIDRALSYDKADRWPSAKAMQSALRQALGELPATPLEGAPRSLPEPNASETGAFSEGNSARAERPARLAGKTTAPASPRALASARRIATGVLVAAASGLAAGVGTWWIMHLSLPKASPSTSVLVPSQGAIESHSLVGSAPVNRGVLGSDSLEMGSVSSDRRPTEGKQDVLAPTQDIPVPQGANGRSPAVEASEYSRPRRDEAAATQGSGDREEPRSVAVDERTPSVKEGVNRPTEGTAGEEDLYEDPFDRRY